MRKLKISETVALKVSDQLRDLDADGRIIFGTILGNRV
jgi:hypothetical protein